MNIMVLGGTRDALVIAHLLIERGHNVLYSIAGLARQPKLKCQVRVGGFGGPVGMVESLAVNNIQCLVDATHPYAAKISEHAAIASEELSMPTFRYTRPAWKPQKGDKWRTINSEWADISAALKKFKNPFFTVGREPLFHMHDIPPYQEWLIRTLAASDTSNPRARVLRSRGPFSLDSETSLMHLYGVDVLVSKNSGGGAVAAKIEAARVLNIPVIMVDRPILKPVTREFASPAALVAALPNGGNKRAPRYQPAARVARS